MNIFFLLTPKAVCSHLRVEDTVRQALERMESTGYSALPILAKDGTYHGSLTEGDLLWAIKSKGLFDVHAMEKVGIMEIEHRKDNTPVSVDTQVEDLMAMAIEQNFVPVVDDKDTFIGIVTRGNIIKYCRQRLFPED
jgi:CBS domain-containing protein